MSTLREVLEARANSGHGVVTHTELRQILAAYGEQTDAIKAEALREAAAEIARLKQIGRTPHNQCSREELDAYYPYAQSEPNTWLRARADALEAQP
ncbi:hypothetical protein [Arthrobacter sp. 31Y]|uniref:hypothetical protein n=1 Tax=Arthrobacter sp. 31Y TaxID=1115632 RepID=UPI0004633781|nr:hypothetical protein [Arthrobacter sp. 31Y]